MASGSADWSCGDGWRNAIPARGRIPLAAPFPASRRDRPASRGARIERRMRVARAHLVRIEGGDGFAQVVARRRRGLVRLEGKERQRNRACRSAATLRDRRAPCAPAATPRAEGPRAWRPGCHRSGRRRRRTTSCRNTRLPLNSLTRMVRFTSRGSVSASWVSSWKWVANSARERLTAVQVLDAGLGDREAVEGRRAAADLVEDDERARRRLIEDRRRLDHLDHEGRAAAGEVVGGADAGKEPVDDADMGPRAPGRRTPSGRAARSARSGADRSICPPCWGR